MKILYQFLEVLKEEYLEPIYRLRTINNNQRNTNV